MVNKRKKRQNKDQIDSESKNTIREEPRREVDVCGRKISAVYNYLNRAQNVPIKPREKREWDKW